MAAKKTTKKVTEQKKEEPKKVEKKSQKATNYRAITIVLAIAVIAAAVYFINDQGIGTAAATVNGEKITLEELNSLYDPLTDTQKETVTKTQILESLVQTKILTQEAEKKGIMTTDEEVEEQIQELLIGSQTSKEQLEKTLEEQGVTMKELSESIKEQLTIQKLIQAEVVDKIVISEEEIQKYYSENVENFETGEQVTVRHLLVGDEELTVEEKEQKAENLLEEISTENFCDKVTEFTTDISSKETCGEYTFGKEDPYVQEFKDLSFEQEPGQMGLVDSQFGTHIIWTVEKTPSQIQRYQDVSAQIKGLLTNQETNQLIEDYVEAKKAESEVKIHYQETLAE